MSIVRINAIEVPEGMGEVLEQRFAGRLHSVDKAPGFEGFEMLRPTGEAEKRYFIITRWADEASFNNWVNSEEFTKGHARADAPAGEGSEAAHGGGHPHAGGHGGPVSTAASVLEFDVVLESKPQS